MLNKTAQEKAAKKSGKPTAKKAPKKASKKSGKPTAKKTPKKAPKKAPAAAPAIDVKEVSAKGLKFADRKRVSIYHAVLEKVKKLKPGRALRIPFPSDKTPVKFRNHISMAIRKQLDKADLLGLVRVRIAIDENKTPVHVAVVCKARE